MTKRRWLAIIMALVFMFSITVPVMAAESNDVFGFVFKVDDGEDAELVSYCVAFYTSDNIVVMTPYCNVPDNGEYLLVSMGDEMQTYPLYPDDEDISDMGLMWWYTDQVYYDERFMEIDSPHQGENVKLVTFSGVNEGKNIIEERNVVLTDLTDEQQLVVDGLDDADAIRYFPGVLLNSSRQCVGVMIDKQTIIPLLADSSEFYGDSPQPTESGTSNGNSGNGGSGSSSGSGGGSSIGNSNDTDGYKGIIIVAVAAAAAGILLRKIKQKKKPVPEYGPEPDVKQKEKSGDDDIPEIFFDSSDSDTATSEFISQDEKIDNNDKVLPSGFSLYAIGGCMDGRIYPIGGQVITFGRDRSSTIRFPADAAGVSRVHCRIFWQNGTLMLMDCGSTNGTFMEGFGRLASQQPVAVKFGTKFYVGHKDNGFIIK